MVNRSQARPDGAWHCCVELSPLNATVPSGDGQALEKVTNRGLKEFYGFPGRNRRRFQVETIVAGLR